MFTDATRVVINNKEVQSITSNGGVIYTAYEPYLCQIILSPVELERLTITDKGTQTDVLIEDYKCYLKIGHTYQFKSNGTPILEENIVYQGEGNYVLTVDMKLYKLTFYEGPFNGITVNTDKNIIQTGETSNITVQVKEHGFPAINKTVNIYTED